MGCCHQIHFGHFGLANGAVYSIATNTTMSHTCRMRELGLTTKRDAARSRLTWVRISSTSVIVLAMWSRRTSEDARPFVRKLSSFRITDEALITLPTVASEWARPSALAPAVLVREGKLRT